jgi:hypothetical protein
MGWLAQHLGLGQSAMANSMGMPTPLPGAGVFARPPSPGGGGSPSLPSGISPVQFQQAQYLTSQGVDPATAWAMASMSQQSSPGATLAASAALPATEVLKAKLEPKLADPARAEQIHVTPAGPLPFEGAPSPMPAMTTAEIIAQLL